MRRTIILLVAIAMASCGPGEEQGPVTITLMAHDSFADAVTEETFAAFTAQTGHQVEVLAAGDAGAMVNQAILTVDNPVADVIFGVDDTFLTRAVAGGILDSYVSDQLEVVQEGLRSEGDLVTPIDYGDVCINYDKAAFVETPAPSTLDDLLLPEYRGQLVVEDPSTSSPGLAFLLATIDRFGEGGWQEYWEGLKTNDILVAPGWTEAYYGEFSGGAGEGDRPLVVSYASSPPAEVIFSETPIDEAPTGVITDGCYRQVEYAGVLSGTEVAEPAGQLIDYMLSTPFQDTIPLTWFVFPASTEATLPSEFVSHTAIPENPVQMDPDLIEDNRQTWLEQWADILR
ncbi:MAG: thiamine ABC transporter substrate-binding protein [Acidimicrobiia bacterium]